jgi:hypothetical protein
MQRINEQVPAGKTLLVGGIRFVGPCTAKATVPDGAERVLLDTPERPVLSNAEIEDRRARRLLRRTDLAMGRVAEDLIDVLVARAVIATGDLTQEAQALLAERKAARSKLPAAEGLER